MKKNIHLIWLTALFLAACGSAAPNHAVALKVLATTTILKDLAQNVAGSRLTVDSLLPLGADPHAYQPRPADVAKVAESAVLILNGLEYEHFIEPLLENAGGQRLTITASDGLIPLNMPAEDDPTQKVGDPHMWLNPNDTIQYIRNIRDGLIRADPTGADEYSANAQDYIAQLQELDAWIQTQVNQIPPQKRLLVTNHQVFGYFAEAYGFRVADSILPSLSSEASASAQELAASIDAIKASGAPVIFLDAAENPQLAKQIAAETGVQVVNTLSLEALTETAPTYLQMMKYNVSEIVKALK
ncbi:MAG: zinc ABC transporter substrate-binding protein [Anaerolineales bacterium]|nr:zinc ABC transporter substrate-binding protein [Anaerolineales bacterium]